jgi:hypothetical protein
MIVKVPHRTLPGSYFQLVREGAGFLSEGFCRQRQDESGRFSLTPGRGRGLLTGW